MFLSRFMYWLSRSRLFLVFQYALFSAFFCVTCHGFYTTILCLFFPLTHPTFTTPHQSMQPITQSSRSVPEESPIVRSTGAGDAAANLNGELDNINQNCAEECDEEGEDIQLRRNVDNGEINLHKEIDNYRPMSLVEVQNI